MAKSADILSEIRSRPHWLVVCHPSQFESERISSLTECWDAMEHAHVRLLSGRGFPRIERESQDRGEDWVGSGIHLGEHREYSRLYQSGQFVHLRAFTEDTWGLEAIRERYDQAPISKPTDFTPSGFLDIFGAIQTFTEIFQFAARLMGLSALDEAPVVKIGMKQVKNRVLSVWSPGEWLWLQRVYWATADSIEHDWQLTGPGREAEAARLAQEATLWFFQRFGYDGFSMEILKREQEEFLSKRGVAR